MQQQCGTNGGIHLRGDAGGIDARRHGKRKEAVGIGRADQLGVYAAVQAQGIFAPDPLLSRLVSAKRRESERRKPQPS